MSLRSIVVQMLPVGVRKQVARLWERIFDVHGMKSYAQEGEDLLLGRLFGDKKHGFYVDVGAHHPRRFSNTHHFYKRGWCGINMDPNPDSIRLFTRARKRDTNLRVAIAEHDELLTYHEFDEPALNTFDGELARWRVANTPYRVVNTVDIAVQPLHQVLSKHLPVGQGIDFLTIDAEGLDFAVLRSNDWQRFRPKYVLVEALDSSVEGVLSSELCRFMKDHGYELFAKMFNTAVFREDSVAAGRDVK